MEKKLNIGSYHDGYSLVEMRCYDHPLAVGAGFFNLHFYYFYCFLYCVYTNWGCKNDSWHSDNPILEKLGLLCKNVSLHPDDNPLCQIKSLLDSDHPVVFPCTYGSIFYHREYKINHGLHTFLITAYSTGLNTFGIKEAPRIISPDYTRDAGLFNFTLTENALLEIWKTAQEAFAAIDTQHYCKIYYLERTSNPLVNDYFDLIRHFLSDVPLECNRFIDFIADTAESLKSEMQPVSTNVEFARMKYVNSLNMFFDIVETTLGDRLRDVDFRMRMSTLRKAFLTSRDRIFNLVAKHIISGKLLDEDEIRFMKNRLRERDKELSNTLNDAIGLLH